MRNIFIISLVLLISVVFIYIKSVINSIQFDYEFDSVGLGNLNLLTLNNKSSFVQIKLLFIIKFVGLFNIKISNLKIQAYYNNVLVGKTSDNESNNQPIVLINKAENKIYQQFDISVNSSLIEMLYKIKTKQTFIIDYNLSFKILGLTINYKNKYENN